MGDGQHADKEAGKDAGRDARQDGVPGPPPLQVAGIVPGSCVCLRHDFGNSRSLHITCLCRDAIPPGQARLKIPDIAIPAEVGHCQPMVMHDMHFAQQPVTGAATNRTCLGCSTVVRDQ